MTLWPRRYIQPDYTIGSRRRFDYDDCGIGDLLALGVFLFVGMLVFVVHASNGREMTGDHRAAQNLQARAGVPAVTSSARIDQKMKRRVRPQQRLAMAPRPSP